MTMRPLSLWIVNFQFQQLFLTSKGFRSVSEGVEFQTAMIILPFFPVLHIIVQFFMLCVRPDLP